MLVITVEMWPHGDTARRRLLGVATIVNDGTGNRAVGNYDVTFCGPTRRPWRKVRVEGFARLRRSPWALLHEALSIGGKHDASS